MRIFSYWRVEDPDKAYPYVRDRLAKAAQLAAKNDIILVLENEHSCNVGTGKELGRLLKDVNSPNLRGVWDPGNATMLGEIPFPDGYKRCAGMFPHMHIKDSRQEARRPASSNGRRWAAASSISRASSRPCIATNTKEPCRSKRIIGGRMETKSRARASLSKDY